MCNVVLYCTLAFCEVFVQFLCRFFMLTYAACNSTTRSLMKFYSLPPFLCHILQKVVEVLKYSKKYFTLFIRALEYYQLILQYFLHFVDPISACRYYIIFTRNKTGQLKKSTTSDVQTTTLFLRKMALKILLTKFTHGRTQCAQKNKKIHRNF